MAVFLVRVWAFCAPEGQGGGGKATGTSDKGWGGKLERAASVCCGREPGEGERVEYEEMERPGDQAVMVT